MVASKHLIELQDVSKDYFTPAGPFTALKNISLTIDPGEFVAVIGKSGSGKSTLINMITGIDRATSGVIMVNDDPIHTYSEDQMAIWRSQNIGIVFQFFQLLPTLTVMQNIMLPMSVANKTPAREWRVQALHLLEQVDIVEQAHKRPGMLSGGQQQRAAIARALANDPAILIADEPTGNLDSKTANQVFGIFEDLITKGKSILMVTHDNSLASRTNRTLMIADGMIVEDHRLSA